MTDDIDVGALRVVGAELGAIGARATPAVFEVFREAGGDLRDGWRDNARETSGAHGVHYPDSVTMDVRVAADIVVEVGPDPSKPQGGMSFEFGSVNQPAHLDGQRAADVVEALLPRRIDAALGHLGL